MTTPHTCPVCDGRGKVPHGFYSQWSIRAPSASGDMVGETCQACNGAGVLWQPVEMTPSPSVVYEHQDDPDSPEQPSAWPFVPSIATDGIGGVTECH